MHTLAAGHTLNRKVSKVFNFFFKSRFRGKKLRLVALQNELRWEGTPRTMEVMITLELGLGEDARDSLK